MAITLQIKKSTASTAPSSLADGELAYTHGAGTQINNGKRLFIGDGSSQNVIGGQYFTDMLDHTIGTLTGSSAIVTDTNSKVDTIKVRGADNSTPGNIVFDDNDSSHATTLKGGNVSSNIDISLPTTAGTVITTGNLTDVAGTIGTLTALTVDNVLIGSADDQTISTSSGVLKLNPATDIDAVNNKIINVANPTATHHATNKGYVDGLIQGLDVKGSVRAASTANATLSTAYANGQTVGGVTVATGDRILIKEQSTGTENGVYTVNASGAPTRATDFDSNAGITAGAFVFVEEGTNGDQGFVLTNNGTITIGSTSLVFTQFSGAGNISAGNGLQQSGTQISVLLPSGSGLAAGGAGLSIAPGGVTDAMMAASSVDLATDTVTNSLTVDHGGTGLTTIAKGSLLVANTADTITALDGGASNTDDKVLLYTGGSDTLGFTSSLDGGTF
tara:strand:- start:549 stop:1886 length:1338 start_codon:yes stop_codon:yes gene_type:complete